MVSGQWRILHSRPTPCPLALQQTKRPSTPCPSPTHGAHIAVVICPAANCTTSAPFDLVSRQQQSCRGCELCPVTEFPLDANASGAAVPTAQPCDGSCDAAHSQLTRASVQIQGDAWCGGGGALALHNTAFGKYLCASDPKVGLKLVYGPAFGCWNYMSPWTYNASRVLWLRSFSAGRCCWVRKPCASCGQNFSSLESTLLGPGWRLHHGYAELWVRRPSEAPDQLTLDFCWQQPPSPAGGLRAH